MHHLPRGTVTLLFTDIEGSTHLREHYSEVLAECRSLLRTAFHACGDHEVDTQEDAFFVAFARATDAVSAAIAAQRILASQSWHEGVAMRVRMGLHTGEPYLAADGYVGLDVHRAARIMNAGYGSQILLSQTTCDLVEHALPEGASLRDLGAHRLKDLEYPNHLYQLVTSGLPADFPPLKTLDSSTHNLPVQLTPLIGREQALAARGAVAVTAEPQAPVPIKSPPTYPDGLTTREGEVLHLLAQGLTDAQIAEQLIISPRTVNTHLTAIYGKIQVSSRSAATRYAIEHHVL